MHVEELFLKVKCDISVDNILVYKLITFFFVSLILYDKKLKKYI